MTVDAALTSAFLQVYALGRCRTSPNFSLLFFFTPICNSAIQLGGHFHLWLVICKVIKIQRNTQFLGCTRHSSRVQQPVAGVCCVGQLRCSAFPSLLSVLGTAIYEMGDTCHRLRAEWEEFGEKMHSRHVLLRNAH